MMKIWEKVQQLKVHKNLFNEKKKFRERAIKHKIIEPYISCIEKYSKVFLFLFDKSKPYGVNKRINKKVLIKIISII